MSSEAIGQVVHDDAGSPTGDPRGAFEQRGDPADTIATDWNGPDRWFDRPRGHDDLWEPDDVDGDASTGGDREWIAGDWVAGDWDGRTPDHSLRDDLFREDLLRDDLLRDGRVGAGAAWAPARRPARNDSARDDMTRDGSAWDTSSGDASEWDESWGRGRNGFVAPRYHAGLLPFARRHLAVVVVALVVAVCLAATYLFRARTAAVPLSVSAATPSTELSRAGSRSASSSPTASMPVGSGSTSGASATAPATITVQVIGAVRRPGLVLLRTGSRVQDAVRAAGGLLPSADPGELNMAIVLADADQVLVGTRAHPGGEVRTGTTASGEAGVGASASAVSTSGPASQLVVDLNTATVAQLDALPGVGSTTAQRIIDWRDRHGRFSSTQELQEVEGIGPKSYAKLAPHVKV